MHRTGIHSPTAIDLYLLEVYCKLEGKFPRDLRVRSCHRLLAAGGRPLPIAAEGQVNLAAYRAKRTPLGLGAE